MVKQDSFYSTLWAVYGAAIVAMNVLAAKQIDIIGLTVTCGIFVSGFVFIAQDLMTELYGANNSRRMILTCYAAAMIMVLLFQLAIAVKPSQFWGEQEAFRTILRTTLRITTASVIAYCVGSMVNVHTMAYLKKRFPKSLFVRALSSTIVGQLLDNGIFAVVAFWGILPNVAIVTMTIGGTLVEIGTEIACYPVLRAVIKARSGQKE